MDVATCRNARARCVDVAPGPPNLRLSRAQDVAALVVEPRSRVVHGFLRGVLHVRRGALDAVERRTDPWRHHLSAGIRRCDSERVHLSGAVTPRVEHTTYARAVQPDGADARTVVRG